MKDEMVWSDKAMQSAIRLKEKYRLQAERLEAKVERLKETLKVAHWWFDSELAFEKGVRKDGGRISILTQMKERTKPKEVISMVNARLHIICGNCGENKTFTYKIYKEDEEECVSIVCENCFTIHDLDSNAIKDGGN